MADLSTIDKEEIEQKVFSWSLECGRIEQVVSKLLIDLVENDLISKERLEKILDI